MKKGFTLIEMVVVVAMLLILSITFTNKLLKTIKNAKDSKAYFIKSQYSTVHRIACAQSEDGGTTLGFQDLVDLVDRHAAYELYSGKESFDFKGAYADGRAVGIGGYLEVGTNTAGTVVKGSTTPLILLLIDQDDGVVILDHPENGKDTRGEEWDGIE